jgi:hypothetical protein
MISRRGLLDSALSVVLGTAAAAAFGRPAPALTLQETRPEVGIGLMYANRCAQVSEHAAILAQLEAQLAARTGPQGSTITETQACPICGCPVTATRTIW